VGERALAACRCPDGWALFHAQRGARLRADARAYAGHPESTDCLLEAEWAFRRRCTDRTLSATLDYLSYEALYVLTPDRTVVCLPLWFGLPLADGPTAPTCGALALVSSPADVRHLDSTIREHKHLLEDALAANLVGVRGVLEALALSVRPRTVGAGEALVAALDAQHTVGGYR